MFEFCGQTLVVKKEEKNDKLKSKLLHPYNAKFNYIYKYVEIGF